MILIMETLSNLRKVVHVNFKNAAASCIQYIKNKYSTVDVAQYSVLLSVADIVNHPHSPLIVVRFAT